MTEPLSGLLSPKELKRLAEEKELAELQKALERKRQQADEEKELRAQFMAGEVNRSPEALERFNTRVRIAAENGQSSLEVLRFPCAWLNDHGRRINSMDPNWPLSLEGHAKRGYEAFKEVLEPKGYQMTAHVVSFKEGIPDEVAIYLTW